MLANRPNQRGLWRGMKLMPDKLLIHRELELGYKPLPLTDQITMDGPVANASQDDSEGNAKKVIWLAAKITHGRRWTVTLQGPLWLSLLNCCYVKSEGIRLGLPEKSKLPYKKVSCVFTL